MPYIRSLLYHIVFSRVNVFATKFERICICITKALKFRKCHPPKRMSGDPEPKTVEFCTGVCYTLDTGYKEVDGMRNLTIKRTKSFVGCLVKMKIYIEDPTANEITINNTPCRKIGDLKNGEEKTFPVEEHAAKVFVIADKVSKSYCNEFYQLPDGQEDISLVGKNQFNPASGNAFRFENNTSEEVAINRKHSARKGLVVLIAAVVVGAIIGYLLVSGPSSPKTPESKTFSSNGMTITLTDEFKETSIENFTVVYDSENIAVFVLKEAFVLADGFENYTLEQYASLVIQANSLSSSEIKTADGLTGFTFDFTNPETKDTYRYFSYVYKAEDAFWLVQFATLSENAEAHAAEITEWAKSIKFSS